MAGEHKDQRSSSARIGSTPTAQELKGAIDAGRTGDKVSFPDPAASPLGTDDEAAGLPDTPDRVATALRRELKAGSNESGSSVSAGRLPGRSARRPRPRSPNIQIYRPQLTSVLSIANRITGVILSLGAVGLVGWLIAGALGPQAYVVYQGAISSWPGQIVLVGFTFAFFLHLCGGIRHLVWDTGHAFELRSIYWGGWIVVASSVVLTVVAWVASFFAVG